MTAFVRPRLRRVLGAAAVPLVAAAVAALWPAEIGQVTASAQLVVPTVGPQVVEAVVPAENFRAVFASPSTARAVADRLDVSPDRLAGALRAVQVGRGSLVEVRWTGPAPLARAVLAAATRHALDQALAVEVEAARLAIDDARVRGAPLDAAEDRQSGVRTRMDAAMLLFDRTVGTRPYDGRGRRAATAASVGIVAAGVGLVAAERVRPLTPAGPAGVVERERRRRDREAS